MFMSADLRAETMRCKPQALGAIMADHTQLDWRPVLPLLKLPCLNVVGQCRCEKSEGAPKPDVWAPGGMGGKGGIEALRPPFQVYNKPRRKLDLDVLVVNCYCYMVQAMPEHPVGSQCG